MILVTGSYALNHHWFTRHPADLDIITDWDTLQKIQKTRDLRVCPRSAYHFTGWLDSFRIEVSIAQPDSTNQSLVEAHKNTSSNDLVGLEVVYCELNWLYALKMSHRFKKDCPHFKKTMRDIHRLRGLGAQIPDQEWFKRRETETLARHPRLNQSKTDFFNTPGITYKYDHDSIHRAMALGDKPAYQYYMSDQAEVLCSKKKWNEVSEETRLNGVLEESLVLALERSQIPFDFRTPPERSFEIALTKVCTSITSGWFREYAWEHYYQVEDLFRNLPWHYTERFKEAVTKGIVYELEVGQEKKV